MFWYHLHVASILNHAPHPLRLPRIPTLTATTSLLVAIGWKAVVSYKSPNGKKVRPEHTLGFVVPMQNQSTFTPFAGGTLHCRKSTPVVRFSVGVLVVEVSTEPW